MKKIIVYTSSTCPKCLMVKNYLKSKGIDFEPRDIANPYNMDELEKLGFSSIPVISYEDTTILGFDPNAMNKLIEEVKGDK